MVLKIIEFDDYQEQSFESAVYPDKGLGSLLALAYVGLGLGEAGEIQNKLKKWVRGDFELTDDKKFELMAEYSDLLWYIAMGLKELGFKMSECATYNIAKLQDRIRRDVIMGDGDHR